jgi:hypothetical protein
VELTLEQMARVVHESVRALQLATDNPVAAPSWEDAAAWYHESSIEGVRAALDGVDPREMHVRWCEHRIRTGWTLGPIKDTVAKTHPWLVDYDELPPAEKAKDALVIAVVRALSG